MPRQQPTIRRQRAAGPQTRAGLRQAGLLQPGLRQLKVPINYVGRASLDQLAVQMARREFAGPAKAHNDSRAG